MEQYIEAEKQLAELAGWRQIGLVGSALIGTPPERSGILPCRGQAMVPQWARDNAATFALMAEHDVMPEYYKSGVTTCTEVSETGAYVRYKDHQDKSAAVRYAIVLAVIAVLKARVSA